ILAVDLRKIYRAATETEAELRLVEFECKWDSIYPMVSQIWRRNWEHIRPFFAHPEEIRKAIYTTNAIESLNMSLRKIIKTRGSRPSEQAALKLLYMALKNVVARWQRNGVQHWREALNQFMVLWGDRIRAATQRSASG